MPHLKPTPLLLRLVGFLTAAYFFLVIWTFAQPGSFVHATEIPHAPLDIREAELHDLDTRDVLAEQRDILGARDGPAITPQASVEERGQAAERRAQEDAQGQLDDAGYTGEFAYFDRGIIGRAVPDGAIALKNGEKWDMESGENSTKWFVLEKSEITGKAETPDSRDASDEPNTDLERRQETAKQVYITVNTCRQPLPTTNLTTTEPPTLTLYISTSPKNTKPGPRSQADLAAPPLALAEGAASFNFSTDSDVYIGVSAPAFDKTWQGSFRYEVAASTAGFYHTYNDLDTFLFLVDTDDESALFITKSITTAERGDGAAREAWMRAEVPFTMYAFPVGAWGATGLSHSYCGIKEAFEGNATLNSRDGEKTGGIRVDAKMTDRYGDGDDGVKWPKGQFHVQGLQRRQDYTGFLVMEGGERVEGLDLSAVAGDVSGEVGVGVGRGGVVWKSFNWTTKADDSCAVIFDLDFCSTVAYAVPSSPQFRNNTPGLTAIYEAQAQSYYENFRRSLAQIPCDTTSTAQYSLARTCDHCAQDYKAWMCSVLIPRCESFDARDEWLVERNVRAKFPNGSLAYDFDSLSSLSSSPSDKHNNDTIKNDLQDKAERWAYTKSRNPQIDLAIQPGPYKELLPCEDLCFDIVRSCPAALGFACPGGKARAAQYGRRDAEAEKMGLLSCNFPGAVKSLNVVRAGAGRVGGLSVVSVVSVVGVVVMLVVGWVV